MESNVDITERTRIDRELHAAVLEKELLLREVQHRVKNNMQIISSMLRLQARFIDNTTIQDLLMEIQNRIHSMVLVHERLSRSQNLQHVSLHEYVRDLANDLLRSYRSPRTQVDLKLKIDPRISLNLDTAIPCGLIINELVSNALMYAFPDGKRGTIGIDVRRIGEKRYELRITDSGVGMPKNFSYENSKSLGLNLVHSLVKKLHGSISFGNENGTAIIIEFTEPNYRERV